MERFQSMRILTFSLILFLASLCMAVDIQPSNPDIYNNFNVSEIVLSIDAKTNIDLKPYLQYLRANKKFYTIYLINDISNLLNSGYIQDLSASVTKTDISTVKIIINIQLNDIIRYIEFNNASIFEHQDLVKMISNKVDTILNISTISRDIEVVEKAYHDKGFILAKVTNVFYINKLKTLFFNIEEGRLHSVSFDGLKTINPKLLIRELKTKPGTVFNANYLNEDRNSLLSLGYFSQVSTPKLSQSKTKSGYIDSIYKIQERKINNLQIGIEQLQNSQLSLALTLKFPNFRNTGEGLYFKGQSIFSSAANDYNYYLKYTDPWFMNQKIPFNVIFWNQVNEESINTTNITPVQRIGWETNWELNLVSDIQTILGYSSEAVKDTKSTSAYNKRNLKLSILKNTTKELNNPLSGYKAYFTVEKGNNFLQIFSFGGIDYVKYTFDYSVFYNLYKSDVLAVHFSTGYVLYNTQSQQLYEQDKFLVGGAYTLRGYDESYANVSNAIIGNRKLLFNIEYRMLFTPWLQGAIFADYGFANDAQIDISDLKLGIGAGIRIFTPIAPLRFDFALGDKNKFVLHFALGQLF